MKSSIRYILAALLLAVCATGGFVAATKKTQAAPESWPMSVLETQNANALNGRVQLLQSEIARVASGDQALSRNLYGVAVAVQALDHDDETLRREAEKRLGIAVVQSGSVWVPRQP